MLIDFEIFKNYSIFTKLFWVEPFHSWGELFIKGGKIKDINVALFYFSTTKFSTFSSTQIRPI